MEILLLLVAVAGWLFVRKLDRGEMQRALARQDEELGRLRDEVVALRRAAIPALPTSAEQGAAGASAMAASALDAVAAPSAEKDRPEAAYPAEAMKDYLVRAKVVRPASSAGTEDDAELRPSPTAGFSVPPPPPPPPMPVEAAAKVDSAFAVEDTPERRSLEQTLGANWLNRLGSFFWSLA